MDAKGNNRYRSAGSLQDTGSSMFYSTNTLFVNYAGLSPNISSSTLRHSVTRYSFSKAERFNTMLQGNSVEVELPSQLSSKTTSLGFGDKLLYQHQWQKKNANEMPGPNLYDVRETPGKNQLKRSFGFPHEIYSKQYLSYNKHQSPDVAKALPGPGEYKVRKEFGQDQYKYKLKGKGRMVNDIKDNGNPSPDKYSPSHKLTSPSRFSKISAGIGEKKDPFKSNSSTPGPKYELPSAFHRVLKRRDIYSSSSALRPFI